MAWRDFLVLSHVCVPSDVVALAREAGLCGWIQWVLEAFPPEVRPAQLVDALDGEDPTIPGNFRLLMLTPPGIGSRHIVGHIFRLPSWNAALYLAGMAWPSKSFLATKTNSGGNARLTWWKSALRL